MATIDEINYNGLQTKDYNTLLTEIRTEFQNIYSKDGELINFDSNTPDGQLTSLIAELGTAIREVITEVYNSCDPTKCSGAVQDTRYQINYLTRNKATFTIQNIDITVNKTVELQGLDGSYNDESATAYAVSDDNGNIWYLIDTTTIYNGTTTLSFRAKNSGLVIPTIGTITNQITIVDGVTNVINNVGYTTLGVNEESDTNFRIRRERSVANYSGNNTDSMIGNLLALDGVDAVNVHTNTGNTTDETGTLPHYMWVVVEGGANTDIAETIYASMAGCGTRGNVTIPLITKSLQTINIKFDRPTVLPLYIKFDVKTLKDIAEVDTDGIKDYIAENLTYNIGENAETSKVTEICSQAIATTGSQSYALNVLISRGGTATAEVQGTGITSATVISSTFQDKKGDTTETYDFTYTANGWNDGTSIVNLAELGISYEGIPINGDMIIIDFTAGTWTNFLQTSSIADKFTTDYNKIYITVTEVE